MADVQGDGPELLDWQTGETRPHVGPDVRGGREPLAFLGPRSDPLSRELEGGADQSCGGVSRPVSAIDGAIGPDLVKPKSPPRRDT